MKKAIILARVSTPEQQKTGLSIDEIQLPKLRQYLLDKGFEPDQEFIFQETASQKLRKKFDAMVQYVKSNPEIKAIIVFKIDRLTRNYRDAVEIDNLRLNYDIQLHFLYEKLILDKDSFGSDIDRWDDAVHDAKKHITRCQAYAIETLQSKLASQELYGKAPYGYKNNSKELLRMNMTIYEVNFKKIKMNIWSS